MVSAAVAAATVAGPPLPALALGGALLLALGVAMRKAAGRDPLGVKTQPEPRRDPADPVERTAAQP